MANKARILRRDGVINQQDGKRRMLYLGIKADSTDFQSALLIGQLTRIMKRHKKRQKKFHKKTAPSGRRRKKFYMFCKKFFT